MVKKRACVFISGTGTNLRSIIKNSREYNFPINIKLVISNQQRANGINFAKKFSIPYMVLNYNKTKFEKIATKLLLENKINLLCLAGFMRVLSKKFIRNFKGNIINIHPSLLPKYKGLNTFSRVLRDGAKNTGCTVHYVNEKLDNGKNIIQKSFFINKNDSIKILKEKTQRLEYKAFSEAIIKIYRYN